MKWYKLTQKEVLEKLKTSKNGLFLGTKKRLKKFGPNELPRPKELTRLKLILSQFKSPLIYILLIAGAVTLIIGEFLDSIVIFAAVGINSIVGFIQENKASQALKKIKETLVLEVIVIREGQEKLIKASSLVPGDIIILRPGNKVPADGRLIEQVNLKVNEAALTGEWMAQIKELKTFKKETPLADRTNMVYMGTIVEEGEAKVVVTETGLASEIGKIALMVRETKEEKTPFQKKLAHFSKIVGGIIAFLCLIIFVEGVLTGNSFAEMFTTSVAVAVAAIPEGLPVAMAVILAIGMQRILKKKGLVRKLVSAETLGGTTVICTDKTGTLTEGRMKASNVLTTNEDFLLDTNGSIILTTRAKEIPKDVNLALKIASICSEAFIENPQEALEKWIVRGRPTDKALLLAGIGVGLDKENLEEEFPKISRLPFDPKRKFILSLHRLTKTRNILFVSGAPEKVLGNAKYLEVGGKQVNLIESRRKDLEERYQRLTRKGLRVIAVGYKITDVRSIDEDFKQISNLVLVGFIGLRDPLRKTAKKMIKVCRKAGLRPIIVTGDHKLTAKAVAEEIGINAREENILTGWDLDKISDEELSKKIGKINVFARVEPAHKVRIINAFKIKGEVVAMTGDGVNDAPALKRADIGIALGSGTDVAKETSDLVLLDDNFSTIVAAVEGGRVIIDNIRKVITYLLSDSFSEVILIGGSMVICWLTKQLWVLPVTAVQILWVNIVEDGFPDIALAFEKKERDVMEKKPEGHKVPLLTTEMKVIIFAIGIITDLILLGLFLWLLNETRNIQYVQTMIFAALGIDSLLYVFSCKSLRRSIWHINPFSNLYLVGAVIFGFLMLGIALYVPVFQRVLRTVPLGPKDWLILISLGIIEIIAIELAKWHFLTKPKIKNKNSK